MIYAGGAGVGAFTMVAENAGLPSSSPSASPSPSPAPGLVGSPWLLPLLLVLLAGLRIAALVISPLGLQSDEAQYWVWAQAPDFGYFSKPPLVAWAIAVTSGLFGDGPAAVRLAAPLAHVATALLVWRLASRLYGARAGFWSGLAFATMPGVWFSAMIMSTDALLLPLWALALFGFERATTTGRPMWWVLVGTAFGAGLMAKYAMAYFALGALIYLLWEPSARAGARGGRWLWALPPAALLFAPNMLWNARHHWASFGHTAANANLGGPLFNPGELGEFALSQVAVFGPFLLLAFGWKLFSLGGKPPDRRPATRFLIAFSVPVLALMLGQAFLSRAHANWAATAYVAATILAVGWLVEGRRQIWMGAIVAVQAVIGMGFLVVVGLGAVPGVEPSSSRDPFKALRGWDQLVAAVAQARATYPDALVVANEREYLVQLMYGLAPDGLAFRKWNPGRGTHDHFDLFSGLEGDKGRDLIIVTRSRNQREFARYGSDLVDLGTVTTRSDGDPRGTYKLWLVHGFAGY